MAIFQNLYPDDMSLLLDLPLIVSGKYIAFIDPHRTTVDGKDTQPAGVRKRLTEAFKYSGHTSTFHGIFDCDKSKPEYSATLFRFPLRQCNSLSKISRNVDSVKDVRESHFESLKSEASFLLLFLNNVKKISLYDMNAAETCPRLLFSVIADNHCQDSLKKACHNMLQNPLTSFVHFNCTTVSTTDYATKVNGRDHWLTLNVIGSSDEEVVDLGKELSTLPWVGLAAQIPTAVKLYDVSYECSSDHLVQSMRSMLRERIGSPVSLPIEGNCHVSTSGQAFCFLPLPIYTALPVHVHGYFAVNDNRRGIKWPGHDENSAEARWNRALIRKLIAPAYSVLLSCKSELFSYEGSLSRISHQSRDMMCAAYSSWPSYSDLKNNHMWLELLQPMLLAVEGSHVLWSAVRGGKWVKLTEAYFIPADGCPSTVIKTLLEAGVPIVVLPDSMYETLSSVASLLQILRSRVVTPRLLRKNFPSNMKFSSSEVHTLLEYILSDLNRKNVGEIFDIELLPLQDKSCCKFSAYNSSNAKYLLTDSWKRDIFPGIDHLIIDTDLPECIVQRFKEIAFEGLTQIRVPNSKGGDIQILFKASLSTWLSLDQSETQTSWKWFHAKQKHPDCSWLKRVWKWIAEEGIAFVSLVGLPLVPQVYIDDSEITLLKVKLEACFCRLGEDMKKLKWYSLFQTLGINVVADAITGNSSHFPCLDQEMVLEKLNGNFDNLGTIIGSLSDQQRELLRTFFSNHDYAKREHVHCLRNLAIFSEVGTSASNFVSLDDLKKPFLIELTWPSGLVCPKGMLCNKDHQVVELIKNLATFPVTFTEFCKSHLVSLVKDLISHHACDHGDSIVLWIFGQILSSSRGDLELNDVLKLLSEEAIVKTEVGEYCLARELYNDDKELKILFDDVAGKTPNNKYCPFTHLLRKMGLIYWKDIVSNRNQLKDILSRSIANIRNGKQVMRRGQFILDQIFDVNSVLSRDDKESFSGYQYKFLLPLKRPSSYPSCLKWFSTSPPNELHCIESLFPNSPESPFLIGAIGPIIRGYTIGAAASFMKPLTEGDVKKQLEYIEKVEFQPKDGDKVSAVVEHIYKYLSRSKTKLNNVWCPSLTPPRFMETNKFAMALPPFDLKPYFYELAYKQFRILWNIKQGLVADDAVGILSTLKKNCDICLSERELKMSGNLVSWLYKQKEHPSCSILLPTTGSQLEAPQDCVYDDREWASSTTFTTAVRGKSLKYVSSEYITPAIAKHFHVRPLSLVVAPSSNLAIEYTRAGQHESITNRISRIVEDYNDDIDIFKELIQNADDAEATEISFLIDWREHPSSSLFCGEMKPWQGPALLVHNNATFSGKDIENICKVAGETKLRDPMKTGRFGLGFCATYHMTDLPSFVSGRYLVIFDPHTSYLGERISPSQPGMKIDLVDAQEDLDYYKDQFVPYNDVFGCDIFSLTENGYNGTLFRFPFRDLETSKHSCISSKVYGRREVNSLVDSLKLNSHELVLFQKHLNQISLYEFKPGSTSMTEIFSVSRECDDLSARMRLLSTRDPVTATPMHCSTACVITSAQDRGTSESAWIVCSSMITSSVNKDLLAASRDRGVLPFGEIALKVSGNGISKSPENVEKGRVFCFLPLPIYNGLKFHVNGHFHVSKDRRNLSLSDDNSFGTQWNTFLSREVHSHAFIGILTHFIADVDLKSYSAGERNKFLESYYQLWHFSATSTTSIAPKIIAGIKDSINASGSEKLLWSEVNGGVWLAIEEVVLFVDYSANKEVISDGLEMLLQLDYKVVQVPNHVFSLVQKKVASFDHMYNYERFVSEILFPRIYLKEFKITWQNSLFYLLNQLSHSRFLDFNWAEKLLQSKPCIPCQQSSELVMIKDLIDCTQEKLAQIYDVSEGKFPILTLLQSRPARSSLIKLEMSSCRLTSKQLVDRAESVKRLSLQCLKSALERSVNFVEYIRYYYGEDFSDIKLISGVPFLIVSKKQDLVQLPWFGARSHFCSPSEAFKGDESALVFTVANVSNVISNVGPFQVQKNPSCQLVVQHLNNLVDDVFEKKLNKETIEYMDRTMIRVYAYLNQKLCHEVLKSDSSDMKALHLIECPIWQDGVFNSASSVIKGCHVTCHPYITRLSERYSEYGALFLGVFGVKKELELGKIVSVLTTIHHDFAPDSPLPDELLQFAILLASDLASKNNNNTGGIFLPDDKCVMRPVHQLACDNLENDWIKSSPTYLEHFESGSGFFVHQDIPRGKAIKLGVRPLLDAIIQEFEVDSFLDGFDYGQHEDLCVRLNSILSKYPADASILQEFIQNADDAQASEIVFILDHRIDHPDKTLLCDTAEWRSLQHTPALCIINNRKFTEEDIKGISDLGRGAKGDSTEKIGKFGIGFNVAYHVTDCPSFLSCGKNGVPENLCMFDPTLNYVHKKGKKRPGRRWELSSKHITDFRDQFQPYLLGDIPNFGSGVLNEIDDTGHTVFRLPLTRTNKGSNISGEKFTTSDIECLFTVFMQSSKEVLLFLNNIKSVSAIEIKEDGRCIHHFTTSSVVPSEYTDNCAEFIEASTKCTAKLRDGIMPEPLSLFHRLDILQQTEAHTEKESWLVQKAVCGTFKHKELELALKQHNLCAVGGVAAPLSSSKSKQYKLFCYLPTPLETCLPVHVNGHFIVDDSRKHLESKQIFGKGFSDWNLLLVEKVIVPAYIELIINAKSYYLDQQHKHAFNCLCQLFPRTTTSEANVERHLISFSQKHLQTDNSKLDDFTTSTLYKQFSARRKLPLLYTEAKNGCWISFEQAIFYLPSYQEGNRIISIPHKLMEVVIELGMNVVNCPHIYHGFTSVTRLGLGFGMHLSTLYQSRVICFLSSIDVHNDDISSIIKENLYCLLEFCIYEKKKKNIISDMKTLPLLLCADGSLQKGAEVYHFKYSRLLPRCLESIVDEKLEDSGIGRRLANVYGIIVEPPLKYIALHIGIDDSMEPCVLATEQVKLLKLLWTILNRRYQATPQEFCSAFIQKPILPTTGNRAYPMCLSKSVIGNPEKNTCELLLKLGYDELDMNAILPEKPDDHVKFLIDTITFSKNTDFLPCFKLGEPLNCGAEISDDEVKLLLTSLCVHSVEELSAISEVLLKLKIYRHADDKRYVSVGSENSVCIVPSVLPKDGFDVLQSQLPTVIFLKEPESSVEDLYKTIIHEYSDSLLEKIDVYVEYILPNISRMDDPQILAHIDYIRSDTNLRNSEVIISKLKQVCFLKSEGKLMRPEELFDPRKMFFKAFRRDNLPCKKWRTDERLTFLCDLGLCKTVSMAEWINQAKGFVSKCTLFTKSPEQLSDILCDELFNIVNISRVNSFQEFLSEVSEISFIYNAKSRSSLFSKAFKLQFNFEMVKFSQSILHRNGPLAFNLRSILPQKCDRLVSNPMIGKLLKVENPIKTETVLEHLKYLSDAVNSQVVSSQLHPACTERLTSIYSHHYKYLDKVKLSPQSIVFMKEFACMVMDVAGVKIKMLRVTQVVEHLPSSLDLDPFCYQLPPQIAQYTNLTEALGIRKELKAEDYGEILASIYDLDDTCAEKIAVCAYNELITCLRQRMCSNEILSDGYNGYVVSEKNEIILSKDLLYNDVPWYAQRIPQHLYKYILSPRSDQQGSRKPPKLLNVRFLSEVVKEKIHDNCKSSDALCTADVLYSQNKREMRCIYSSKILATLKSSQFVEGMFRIYYADHKCRPPEDFQKTVRSFVQFEITCLETPLTTVLCSEDNTIIQNSEDLMTLSTLIRDEGILFISPHGQDLEVQTLVRHISSQLNLALNDTIKNEKNIAALFEFEPECISYGLTTFHHIPEFSLDKDVLHSSSDSSKIGDSISLSTLTVEDATIIVNFRRDEIVRYYSPAGELLLAKVMKSHNNSGGEKVTGRCIEIAIEDPEDQNAGMHSILVSPLEIFKVLTTPQVKSLRSNESSPFASPLIMAAMPCKSVTQMKQWFRDFYLSDDLLMYSGLLISLIKIRLIAHLHHKLLVKDITPEMFRQAVFEVLHYAANEQLPYTPISAKSDLGEELFTLTCAMEQMSIADEDTANGCHLPSTLGSDSPEAGKVLVGSPMKLRLLGSESASCVEDSAKDNTEQLKRLRQQKCKSAKNFDQNTQGGKIQAQSSTNPASSSTCKPTPSASSSTSPLRGTSSHSRADGHHKVGNPFMAPLAGKAYSRFTNPTPPIPQRRSRFEPAPPTVIKQPPMCEEKARAWLEQAKVDYKAAQDILQVPASDNKEAATKKCQFPALVCFLCHDVVEKCLKGLLYIFVEDIKCTTMNCSNLVTLMHQFKAQGHRAGTLHGTCSDAAMVVSIYESKSRYPNFHNPPCAPAAIYLREDAVEAFSAVSTLMEKLQAIQVVHDILGDLNVVPKPRFISAMKSTTAESKLYILSYRVIGVRRNEVGVPLKHIGVCISQLG